MIATPPSRLRLFHYWRSTSSWRVRFALAHKGASVTGPIEMVAVNLLADESEQPAHLARNPMGYVPVLELLEAPSPQGGLRYLGESLAILEWLEETYPQRPLLPRDPFLRARTRQLSEWVNAGTQPLVNMGVGSRHSADAAEQKAWNQHWLRKGMEAYEALVVETAGRFSVGDELTLADICLIPQCYSATRNDVAVSDYPTLARIQAEVMKLEAYTASHPDRYAPVS